jgi:hypothetical protein
MDRVTEHELDNLLDGYRAALHDVEHAVDDDGRLAAWHKVQTLGWRLHELLPPLTPT